MDRPAPRTDLQSGEKGGQSHQSKDASFKKRILDREGANGLLMLEIFGEKDFCTAGHCGSHDQTVVIRESIAGVDRDGLGQNHFAWEEFCSVDFCWRAQSLACSISSSSALSVTFFIRTIIVHTKAVTTASVGCEGSLKLTVLRCFPIQDSVIQAAARPSSHTLRFRMWASAFFSVLHHVSVR